MTRPAKITRQPIAPSKWRALYAKTRNAKEPLSKREAKDIAYPHRLSPAAKVRRQHGRPR